MNIATGVVLVVDDDPQVLAALRQTDLGPQFTVHLCSHIKEARTLLADLEIEVALVDQELAKGDPSGLEFLSSLRNQDEDCFRIIMTDATDLAFAVNAINQGVIDALVVKPWSEEQLISLLNQGCETSLLRRHNRQLAQELAQRNAELEELNEQLERKVEERTASLRITNEHLQEKQAELVRLETQATVTQIARGLAHELNNPLAAILGYSQRLLRKLGDDADIAARLQVILNEVDRCRSLVEQLRNLASPLEEALIACDVIDAVNAAAERLRTTGITPPKIVVSSAIPLVVAARNSFIQVLVQILDNARLAGATKCMLSAEEVGDRIRIYLDNDGQSVNETALLNAFRPFFTTRQDDGHRGLGLTMAMSLLREQNGMIEIDQRPDQQTGARLVITLPKTRGDAPSRANPIIGPPIAYGKVLVVDDDPMIAELIGECLQDEGIDAVIVHSGVEAELALRAHNIRAVIADYHLEHTSGVTVLRHLIRLQPSLAGHVAVFTGANDEQTLQRIVTETGYRVLPKPFRIDQVQQLVADIMA